MDSKNRSSYDCFLSNRTDEFNKLFGNVAEDSTHTVRTAFSLWDGSVELVRFMEQKETACPGIDLMIRISTLVSHAVRLVSRKASFGIRLW
jgi:hypothetical protein